MSEYVVIALFILVWAGTGAIGGAMHFSYLIYAYPAIAETGYDTCASRYWASLLVGPPALLLELITKKERKFSYSYGLLFPGKKARLVAHKIESDLNELWDRAMCEREGWQYDEMKGILEAVRKNHTVPLSVMIHQGPRATVH
jgi:hypothetical protein